MNTPNSKKNILLDYKIDTNLDSLCLFKLFIFIKNY